MVRPAPPAGDHIREALALDQLHRIEMHILLVSDRMDGHDVRVIERRGGTRFDLEPLQATRVEQRGVKPWASVGPSRVNLIHGSTGGDDD